MLRSVIDNIFLLCLMICLFLITTWRTAKNGHTDNNAPYCKWSEKSAEIVKFCPNNKDDFERASKKKNCEAMAEKQSCTEKSNFKYHCVINEFEDKMVEVCAPAVFINGYCAEFNSAGARIKEHLHFRNGSVAKPFTGRYISTDAYKYSICYSLVTETYYISLFYSFWLSTVAAVIIFTVSSFWIIYLAKYPEYLRLRHYKLMHERWDHDRYYKGKDFGEDQQDQSFSENEPKILRVFNDAYEKANWEIFNSMYYELLLAKARSIVILRSHMMEDLYHFVELNIGQNVKKVYYGFCLQSKQSVMVIVVDNVFFDKEKLTTYRGLPILYKQWTEMTEESVKTRKYECNEDAPILNEDVHSKLHECMRQNSAVLMKSHSNIEIISASPFRSIENGEKIRKENCILIYCTMKNVIPLGETFFPKNIREFRIDVREGFFYRYPRSMDAPLAPTDRHPELKIGAEISREDGNLIGTLGGFVNFGDRNEIGFITCAHVIHDEPEKMIENDTRVVQPSFGLSWENNVCGVVIKSVHPRSSDKTTVDASLVKVDSSRKPTRISFTGLRMDKMAKIKFSPGEIYEGKILENAALNASCYKFGATTNFTSGKLEGRLFDAIHLSDFRDPDQNSEYRDQYIVSRISSVFADHGDSGAFVFQCEENGGKKSLVCIGMVVGGTSDFKVVVTPIREVLNALDLQDTKKLCTLEDEQMETDVTDEKSTCYLS